MTLTRLTPLLFLTLSLVSLGEIRAQSPNSPPSPTKTTLQSPSIVSVLYAGKKPKAGSAIKLKKGELEIKRLENFDGSPYSGKVKWDVTTPDNSSSPIKVFQIGKTKAGYAFGYRPGEDEPSEYEINDPSAVAIYYLKDGKAVISAWGVDPDGMPTKMASLTVECGAIDPIPPGPTPTPVPPGPTPPIPPQPVNPLPSSKLRVLALYETSTTLTMEQRGVIDSALAHAAVSANGGDWRVFDKDADLSKYVDTTKPGEDWWYKAQTRAKEKAPNLVKQPYVIISSPKGYYEGHLPSTLAEYIELIKRY